MGTEMTPEQLQAFKRAQDAVADLQSRYRPLEPDHLDILFRGARSHNGWSDRAVEAHTLRELFDLVKMGPTSFNCSPARFVFITSEEGKARIKPALVEQNVEKSLSAPVLVIVAHDLAFYEHFPKLLPIRDVRPMFEGKPELIESTAFRNGTLQGAYLMIAARALGLDCGPMSGFNNQVVDDTFFAGTQIKSNFLCALGHGDPTKVFPRLPRFDFEEACQIA
ncbi:MAG: malonic semialdehyde reductase [Pseudomonadota bacterium]